MSAEKHGISKFKAAVRKVEHVLEIAATSVLQDGWETVRTADGRIFYFNKDKQESTWHRPVKRHGNDGRWIEHVSSDGKPYFYHDPKLGGNGTSSWLFPQQEGTETAKVQKKNKNKEGEDEEEEEEEEADKSQVSKEATRKEEKGPGKEKTARQSGQQGREKGGRRSSWVAVNAENGSTYYYDDPSLGGTGKTAWQKPAEEAAAGKAPRTRKRNKRQSWVEHKTKDNHTFYYDDPKLGGTGESTWEKPNELVISGAAGRVGEAQLKGNRAATKNRRSSWVQHKTEDNQTFYYDDPELGGTGKSTWTKPEEGVLDEKDNDSTSVEKAKVAGGNRRSSWVQHKTKDNQKFYYDDPRLGGTGRSTWERPLEMQSAASNLGGRRGRGSSTSGQNSAEKVSVYIATWNVGNAEPSWDEIQQHLLPQFEDPDTGALLGSCPGIIVIGTQECKYEVKSKATSGSSGKSAPTKVEKANHWDGMLQSLLSRHYYLVQKISLLEMRLNVFALKKLSNLVSDVHSSTEATGLGHVYGNKGGLAIKFNVAGMSLCFISCHLAAHMKNLGNRNEDCSEIIKNLRLENKRIDMVHQFDHVFLLGDLNYRIDMNRVRDPSLEPLKHNTSTKALQGPSSEHWSHVKALVDSKNWEELLKGDQLTAQVEAGFALFGFQQKLPDFNPTFKVERRAGYNYVLNRVPSWCDRILWHSLPGSQKDVKNILFEAIPEVTSSDHKPVRAIFEIKGKQKPTFAHVASTGGEAKRNFLQVRISGLQAYHLPALDSNGLSDPYVVFFSNPPGLFSRKPKKGPRTIVKTGTIDPVWKEDIVLQTRCHDRRELAQCHIIMAIMDHDRFGTDDHIGFAAIPLHGIAMDDSSLHETGTHKWELLREAAHVLHDHSFRVPVVLNGHLCKRGAKLDGKRFNNVASEEDIKVGRRMSTMQDDHQDDHQRLAEVEKVSREDSVSMFDVAAAAASVLQSKEKATAAEMSSLHCHISIEEGMPIDEGVEVDFEEDMYSNLDWEMVSGNVRPYAETESDSNFPHIQNVKSSMGMHAPLETKKQSVHGWLTLSSEKKRFSFSNRSNQKYFVLNEVRGTLTGFKSPEEFHKMKNASPKKGKKKGTVILLRDYNLRVSMANNFFLIPVEKALKGKSKVWSFSAGDEDLQRLFCDALRNLVAGVVS
eukprot:g4192.t1